MRDLLQYGISALFLIAFLVLLGAVQHARNDTLCERIRVDVDMSKGMFFLHKKDIRDFLSDREDSLKGRPLGDIDLNELERELQRIPEVKEAQTFYELDGTLRVGIDQRRPIARFISDNGSSYYWDQSGERMPLSPQYTPRVPVVTVAGDEPVFLHGAKKHKAERFHQFLLQIQEDPFWRKQIQEIHFGQEKRLELVPLVGDHRVIFGDLDDAEEKMRKLRIFYREASAHTGLDRYDALDLRYGDQVVGKKKAHGGT